MHKRKRVVKKRKQSAIFYVFHLVFRLVYLLSRESCFAHSYTDYKWYKDTCLQVNARISYTICQPIRLNTHTCICIYEYVCLYVAYLHSTKMSMVLGC